MNSALRKAFAAITVAICLFSLPCVFAAPSESTENTEVTLEAPQELIWYASRPVGHTAVYLGTYVPPDISGFDSEGYDIAIQYDWSIGNDEDWHYTPEWDNYTQSPLFDKVGDDELLISEAFWLLYDETFELFASVANTEEDSDGNLLRYIDFTENQVYMRARYIQATDENGNASFSDWSAATAILDQNNAAESLTEVKAPILSDLAVNEREVSFCITSDSTFRQAALLLKLMQGDEYTMECKFFSNAAEITATTPYAEGTNIISLPDDFTLSNEGIMTLNVDIFHENGETGIDSLDNIPSPSAITCGNEIVSAVSSSIPVASAVSSDTVDEGLNNTQIGAILVGTVVVAVILAVLLSSVGKKRRKRSAW